MRRNIAIIATLSLATAAFVTGAASAAEPASPPAKQPVVDQPAAPVVDGTKIGKSRSNIQNNREAPTPPPVKPVDPKKDPQDLVKPKTKSNQSND